MSLVDNFDDKATVGKKRICVVKDLILPYLELEKCARLLDKKTLESFKLADKAFLAACEPWKDLLERVNIYRAYANCYSDMGLDEKAAEMTNKWKALIQENTL